MSLSMETHSIREWIGKQYVDGYEFGMPYSCLYSCRMDISDRLDEAMTGAKFESQSALARASGVPQPTINRILKRAGKKGPEADTIRKLAAACNVSFDWLNEGIGEKTRQTVTTPGYTGHERRRPQEGIPGAFNVDNSKFRKISAFGKAMGGLPDRIFDDDGGWPTGFSDVYAEVASSDQNAFLCPIEGFSMSPRYNPGEYALVEPNTAIDLEDDVLVRLKCGRTMLKRLLSQRGATRLGSYNDQEIISVPPEDIIWMYYVAHPVPTKKIKTRI